MKTLPALLNIHMQGGSTTLADLLKITRKDGAVYAFTSAGDDVTIDGVLYLATQGLDISSIEVSAGLAVDNLELTTLDDGTTFSQFDVLAGKWNNADFVISRYNWQTPTDGVEVRMVGTIGQVRMLRGSVVAELRGLQQALQQPIGSITSKTCRARLGDAMCRVVTSLWTVRGVVTSSTGTQTFASSVFYGAGDPSFAQVDLLLHGNGDDLGTTFTDNSPSVRTVTQLGTTALSTTTRKFGSASINNGAVNSGNCLKVGTSADNFLIFTTDFTVELWFYQTADTEYNFSSLISRIKTNQRTSISASSFELGIAQSGGFYYPGLNVYLTGAGSSFDLGGTIATALNKWNHVAVVRSGTSLKLYVNGFLSNSRTASGVCATNSSQSMIGGSWDGTNPRHSFRGYIDDVRVTKAARYIAPFSLPIEEFPDSTNGAALPAFSDGYFSEGILTWLTGTNSGLSHKVKSSLTDGSITLSLPMLSTAAVDDTFSVIAGCQKRLTDCSTKFDNVLNFQGEPHLPGIDQLTAPA